MTDSSKQRTLRPPWAKENRMEPEKELKVRRELGGTRIRFIPKMPKPPEGEVDS